MRRHSELGPRHHRRAGMHEIATYVLHLHERWDGRGYPAKLAGEEIPLPSRILHVADMVEAMTSTRVYRPRLSLATALEELERMRGTQIDPEVGDAMLELIRSGELSISDGDGDADVEPLRAIA